MGEGFGDCTFKLTRNPRVVESSVDIVPHVWLIMAQTREEVEGNRRHFLMLFELEWLFQVAQEVPVLLDIVILISYHGVFSCYKLILDESNRPNISRLKVIRVTFENGFPEICSGD